MKYMIKEILKLKDNLPKYMGQINLIIQFGIKMDYIMYILILMVLPMNTNIMKKMRI